MNLPGDVAPGVLDVLSFPLRLAAVAFFRAYLSRSLCLFNSFGSAICPASQKYLLLIVHIYLAQPYALMVPYATQCFSYLL